MNLPSPSGSFSLDTVRSYFLQGHTRSFDWRKNQLIQMQRFLKECEAEILLALHQDLRKSSFEGLSSEIGLLRKEISHALKHLHRWMQPKKVPTSVVHFPATSQIELEPLGVVLVLGAWNFPLQLVLLPLINALAAGNCVCLSPSEIAPHTASLLHARLGNYLDNNAVQVVVGGPEVKSHLLDQRFDHIFFTGNDRIGRLVMQKASYNLTPITLELGGKSPCLVDSSADLELAARRIVWGKFMNCGQVCIAPDYILAENSIFEPLIAALKKHIIQMYGHDAQKSKDYGRIINLQHFHRLKHLLNDVEVCHGGQTDSDDLYMAPTLVINPQANAACLIEEIFGPILPILPYASYEEARAFMLRREKPLALYVFSKDDTFVDQVQRDVTSGALGVNDTISHVANPYLPFGGVGSSGIGAYHGQFGFERLSHKRAVFKKGLWLDVPLRYPPFGYLKERIVAWWFS